MQANKFRRSLIALAVVGAFGIGAVTAERAGTFKQATAAAGSPATVAAAPATTSASALPDFADLVAQNGAAVVQISVSKDAQRVVGRHGMPKGDDDDDSNGMLPPWFRNFPMPKAPETPSRGVGSGFIVGSDGIVLTNAHVVDGADEVTVRLTDRREFKAKVLGTDKTTDVAVLKIDAKSLPTVKIGNPETTRVGEWVVAIGTPYGLDNTVTSGIVSAKSRSLPGDTAVPFIQTDAAVNPGNSGGPLFNMKGEVIGINSQIFSRSGGFQGVAFAIPIDVAMNVKDQIQQHGKVQHGRLGVSIQDVNQALADNFGMKDSTGALVGSVAKDGAAAKAGVEPGDVILKFDGKVITRSSDLPPMVARLKPGSSVAMELWHDGKTKDVTVTVGELEDKAVVASAKEGASQGKLGVAVRGLTEEEKKASGVAGGVVVEDVAGAAARAGVQPGDVILSVNRTPVKNPEQLKELIGKAGKTVALLVQREDARIFIPVTIG
ncbi:MAG TPA: Do family serine endopeptidase [Rhizomicrobium sp.]|nr:Do family serine endopeptidase [Rhizomicrobium sp.]